MDSHLVTTKSLAQRVDAVDHDSGNLTRSLTAWDLTLLEGRAIIDTGWGLVLAWADALRLRQIIMKLLDAGAFGIICPMINSRAEAEAFVGACRYAPVGYRSFGPVRAGWVHGGDYFKNANQTVLAIAMIETSKAMDNLEEILSTPGLDGIYVGPADLAISMGRPPQGDPTDDVVNGAIDKICAAAKRHGVRPGIHTASPAGARNMIDRGFQFTTILSDNALLANAAKSAVAAARGVSGGPTGPKGPY